MRFTGGDVIFLGFSAVWLGAAALGGISLIKKVRLCIREADYRGFAEQQRQEAERRRENEAPAAPRKMAKR